MPKVSIIVTVFNRTEYLPIALRGALDQSFDEYEIIVTDDSGRDAIRDICQSFGSPKIRYRRNQGTLGIALNLRRAIEEAQGKYIAILNDDDVWEPDFLKELVSALEPDEKRVLAFSDHWIIDSNGIINQTETDANTERYGRADLAEGVVADLADVILMKNGVPLAMASVFRTAALDLNRLVLEVSGAYDYWISLMLAASGGRAYYVPKRLTRYRIHDAMETGRKSSNKNENLVYINRTLLDENLFPSYREVLRERYAFTLYIVGKDTLMFKQRERARDYLQQSLKIRFDKKALACLALSYMPAPVLGAVLNRRSS